MARGRREERKYCYVPWCRSLVYGHQMCFQHKKKVATYGSVYCLVPGCTNRMVGARWCSTHHNRLRLWGTLESPNEPLPAQPLMDYVNACGGLGYALRRAGKRAQDNEIEAWYKKLERARKVGTITPTQVDTICVKLLGVHPWYVYGDAWWLPVPDAEAS